MSLLLLLLALIRHLLSREQTLVMLDVGEASTSVVCWAYFCNVSYRRGKENPCGTNAPLPSPWITPGLLIEFDGSMCVLLAG